MSAKYFLFKTCFFKPLQELFPTGLVGLPMATGCQKTNIFRKVRIGVGFVGFLLGLRRHGPWIPPSLQRASKRPIEARISDQKPFEFSNSVAPIRNIQQ